jgi:cadmium resistance protein CadD (predicted permease)
MELIFLAGIYGFLVTSVDDFVVLCHLFTKHNRKLWSIVLGTAAGLAVVVLGSWFIPNIFGYFGVNLEKIAPFLITLAMWYITYGIIKNEIDEEEDENGGEEDPFSVMKSSFKIFLTSGSIYVANGTDDLVTYVSFLIGYNETQQLFYIIGIFAGLIILCFMAYWSKNKIDRMPEKIQQNIKYLFAAIAVIIALGYLWKGLDGVL